VALGGQANRKKRIAFAIAAAGVLVLTGRTCVSESATATIEVAVGRYAPLVRSVTAVVLDDAEGQVMGRFYRSFPSGGAPSRVASFSQPGQPGFYTVEVTVGTVSGERVFRRGVHLADGATVTLDLSKDLTGP